MIGRLPRAEREHQVLETARIMFAERGFAAVTMDEIAAEVGVTKPLLYTYFGNKEGLYLACMEPAAEALVDTVAAAVAATETPGAAMRAGVHAFFIFVDADRSAWRVLFDETLPAGAEPAAGGRAARAARRPGRGRGARTVPAERRDASRVESRRSRPRCWEPPRRSRAGGCVRRRCRPPTRPSCSYAHSSAGCSSAEQPPARWCGLPHPRRDRPSTASRAGPVSRAAAGWQICSMTFMLRRIRSAVVFLGAETRPDFKRVDASPALYDDGSWLTSQT